MRLVTRSAWIVTSSLFSMLLVAPSADAAVVNANMSRGNADLSWETRTPIVGPWSDLIGDPTLQVRMSANLDPVKDPSKPMIAVAMKPAVLEATWADNKEINLGLVSTTSKDGELKVQHTLAPHITLFLNAFGFSLTYDYEASDLINLIPGSQWNYDASGSSKFEPWMLKGVAITNVQGPPLQNAQLFSIPLPAIGDPSSPLLEGNIAYNATTSPTFNYATTEVVLDGGDVLTEKNPNWKVPTTDEDFLEVQAQVKGKIVYSGDLWARPTISITKIGSFTLPAPLTLNIAAGGVKMPYASGETPIPVVFQTVKIHIPLPNVKAVKTLDLGAATVGQSVMKQAEVKNTGELGAVLSIKSSDPQFTVAADKSIDAKGKLDLEVTFKPTAAGVQSAEITVASNDPNEPVQIIKVTGNGTNVPKAEDPSSSGGEGDGDDKNDRFPVRGDEGCGCRTTPAPTSSAAFVGLGLALAAILRRKRSS